MKPKKRRIELERAANVAEKIPGGDKVNAKQVVASQWSEKPSVLVGAQKGIGMKEQIGTK